MTPEFPIRIITSEGECEVIDSPDDLIQRIESIDSGDGRTWIRDAADRTVRLVIRNGIVEALELL
jgi:hypothetical protein